VTEGIPVEDFQHVFDTSDARASNCIMLTSVDTHAERATYVEIELIREAVPFFLAEYENGKDIFEKPEVVKETYCTHMAGRWLYVIVDEMHAVKTPRTRNFAGIYSVQAKYKILLTATPMQNKQSVRCHFGKTEGARYLSDSIQEVRDKGLAVILLTFLQRKTGVAMRGRIFW